MIDVLVTVRFDDGQLARLRAVSPRLSVRREDAREADYSRAEVLYAGAPPRDLERAPKLGWVQLHLAGVDALTDHPLYCKSAVPLTTTSGVHAATIAEYAITALLALCHRVPRMVEWKGRSGWPPDAERWPLVRSDGDSGHDPRHHRVRQHRARAGAHGQDGVRHAHRRAVAGSTRAGSTRAIARPAPAIPTGPCPTSGCPARG